MSNCTINTDPAATYPEPVRLQNAERLARLSGMTLADAYRELTPVSERTDQTGASAAPVTSSSPPPAAAPPAAPPNRQAKRVAARVARDVVRGQVKDGRRKGRPTGKRRRPRADRATRRERKEAADARQDRRMLERQIAWVESNEVEGVPLQFIPRDVFALVRAIALDHSGACGRQFLRMCINKVYAGAARKCAFIPGELGDHFDWEDERARHTIAVAALLFCMGKAVKPRDTFGGGGRVERRGRFWGSIVTGITRNLILTVLDPHRLDRIAEGRRVHGTGYLTGTYGYGGTWDSTPFDRGGERGPGCGIIVALEQCGVLYRDPWQSQTWATSSGYQPNQYWITCATPEYGRDNADTARRSQLFDAECDAEHLECFDPPGPFDVWNGPEPPPLPAQLG